MILDDSVLDQFPRQLVRHHKVLPLFVDNDVLLVACIDEIGHELEDEFRLRFEGPIRGAIATPLQLNQAIAKYYAAGVRNEAVAETAGSKSKAKARKQPKSRKTQSVAKDPAEQQQLVILIACWMIIGAVLLDQFVVRPYLLTTWSFPYVTTLIAIPAAAYYYWIKAIK